MAGRKGGGGQRPGAAEKIGELHCPIAGDAGYRRFAGQIAVGEIGDDGVPKTAFEIEHVMGNAEPRRRTAGVMDIIAGTAGAASTGSLAGIVELESDADDIEACALEQGGGHRRVDAARHRQQHPHQRLTPGHGWPAAPCR